MLLCQWTVNNKSGRHMGQSGNIYKNLIYIKINSAPTHLGFCIRWGVQFICGRGGQENQTWKLQSTFSAFHRSAWVMHRFCFWHLHNFCGNEGEILLHQRSHLFGCLDDNKLWRGLLQRFNLTDTRTQRPETCCAARVADMLSLSQVYCSLKMVFTTLF